MKTLAIIVSILFGTAGIIVLNWHFVITPIEISPITSVTLAELNAEGDDQTLFAPKGIKLFQADIRPLFSPGRRPWVAPIQEVMPNPEALNIELLTPILPAVETLVSLEVRLIGIQKTPDGEMALLVNGSGATPIWVKIGALFKDWKVEEITKTTVSLANGQSTVKLDLYPELATGTATP